MMLAIRNKQMMTFIALIVLTLLLIAFIIVSVAHINIGQALHIIPSVAFPYF
ncbi:hypothetical protein KDK_72740 [Dictyobacter kobayashii]|uniref:Uncharacterized protein n=1 Tax=Dictyobacter kobayashii TaxID=2014872 RepID=A0A402AWP6_9CHLR|nr:hypothetical protein KDK_72740 [Dictyobacter kobayashii]